MLDKIKAEAMIPYESDEESSRVLIRVIGVTPLLTHNPQSMGVEVGPTKGSRVPSPEDEAEAGAYRLEDGSLALKGEAFRGALIGAATAYKARAKKTMRSMLSHVVVSEELVQLLHPTDNTAIKDYIIDRRRAIVQKSGIIRARPRFDSWSALFHIEFNTQMTNADIILEVCADGGKRMGVGDYRPQKNGNLFGN